MASPCLAYTTDLVGVEIHDMSEFVWYQPLDGIGDLAVDLHKCRRFVLQVYNPFDGADYGLAYYMFHDDKGNVRWIACRGDEDVVVDGDGQRMEYGESYREQQPEAVAHNFLHYPRYGDKLPPALEKYRGFGRHERFTLWIMETNENEKPETRAFRQVAGQKDGPRRNEQ